VDNNYNNICVVNQIGSMNFIANEFDGEYYVVGQQGELEEVLLHRLVLVLEGDRAVFGLAKEVAYNSVSDAVKRTVKLNYHFLRSDVIAEKYKPDEEAACKIAYLRVLALLKGLGDTANDFVAHGLTYSDIRIVAGPLDAAEVPDGKDGVKALDADKTIALWDGLSNWRAETKKKFTNMVCCVAYVMRVRGHHHTADSQDKYVNLWKRCLYEENDAGVEWEYVAHHAFHFIYPDVLDQFWTFAVENSRCAGTLIKRYDAMPAGVAAVGAVGAGSDDILVVLPAMKNVLPDAFAELEAARQACKRHRWNGSINKRFYGGSEVKVDEKRLGALAAVIVGALDTAVSSAPLRNSKALKRVAENAPITGAVITQIIGKAVADERMVNSMFLEFVEE